MLTERTVTQQVGTSLNSPLQWLHQAHGDHSWNYLFNSYSDGATGWQQRWESASSVHQYSAMGTSYVYQTSTAIVRGPGRDFIEALSGGVLCETGCNRNGSNATVTCIK